MLRKKSKQNLKMNNISKYISLIFFVLLSMISVAQRTNVQGIVTDKSTGEVMPFVKVQFKDTKSGAYTDTSGFYSIDTYYANDSLIFSFSGYKRLLVFAEVDETQIINVELDQLINDLDAITIRPPDEPPGITLHKKLVANKKINNKEKLNAYEYELYNKLQFDVNNLDGEFKKGRGLKKLDFVLDYMDSVDADKPYLPILLTESISDFYFKNRPKKKIEVMKAYQVSGSEQMTFNQFLGDMYLDVNVYENYIPIFGKAFVSPTASFARGFYEFMLMDSMFIDNQWCYKLTYKPKRTGELTFEGEMWIHDTTYAVKQFKGKIAEDANINFIQDMYFEHNFDMVAPEVWMLTEERMIADINLTQGSKMYGFYGRKYSSRKNFIINEKRPKEFYKSDERVKTDIGADTRSAEWWKERRHKALSEQEERINEMVDSLENNPYFNLLKNLTYMATTGYYTFGKIEVGSVFNFFSTNPIEKYRIALSLRTSNNFSKKVEFGGRLAYGFGDDRFKYLGTIRANLSKRKRTLLSLYYNYDIEQLGASSTAAAVGSTFGTLFRTGPLDKLSFINRIGGNIERDAKKDLILKGGFEFRSVEAIGRANYVRVNPLGGLMDTINSLSTSEVTASIRWAKDEEFISGVYDRASLRSKYPVLKLQGTFGIKGLFGSDYEYQRLDLFVDHVRQTGIFGRIRYGGNVGKVFGKAAYPFLKIHEGSQSYWLLTSTFNKLNFYEFISDEYATVYAEQHWDGFFLNRVPLMKKLKWRMVTGGRATIGSLSANQGGGIAIPSFTKSFNNIPYAEASVGVENIFKFGRVDIVWRLTHLNPNINPIGFRARLSFNF